MATVDLKNAEASSTPWLWKTGWKDRSRFLMESGKLADCVLFIGEQRQPFKCHKLQLSIASPVFEEFFYAPKKCDVAAPSSMELPDVSVQIFGHIRNFIYVHEITKAPFPYDLLFQLLWAAKRFKMDDLQMDCSNHLASNSWPLDKILPVYDTVMYYKDDLLIRYAIKHTVNQMNTLLNCSTMNSLSFDTFKDVMLLLGHHAPPLKIYEAVEKYCIHNQLIASAQLDPENDIKSRSKKTGTKPKDVKGASTSVKVASTSVEDACSPRVSLSCDKFWSLSAESRSEKRRELCKLVPFNIMPPEEFATGPATASKLLNRDEILEIFMRICQRHRCINSVPKK